MLEGWDACLTLCRQNKIKCCLSHPAGLPALPGSADLKVTFLAQVAVPKVLAGLPVPTARVADDLSRCSSSINKSRKDSDEGGDCTAVALSMHTHSLTLSVSQQAGKSIVKMNHKVARYTPALCRLN